jgi:hypothetical protein
MNIDPLLRTLVRIEKAAALLVPGTFSAAEANALAELIGEQKKILRQAVGAGPELDRVRGEIAVAMESLRSLIAQGVDDNRKAISSASRAMLDLIDHFFRLSNHWNRAA